MNEFDRIASFLEAFDVLPSPQGPGDDCAVLPPSTHPTCVTVDAVTEGVHFTRRTSSLEDVGHKALAVNLSDLAAMGARPSWGLCALGLPEDVSGADLKALSRGMAALARAHGLRLVGGNLSRSLQLTVTVTVGGALPPGRRPLQRRGARVDDVLYLTGPTGLASAGLSLLENERPGHAPIPRRWRPLLDAQRRPTPQVAVGLALAPFASAGIDVSDGLLQDLGHLCRASGVGACLDSERVPLADILLEASRARDVALRHALSGGEDYVLLLSVPPKKVPAFEAKLETLGCEGATIGRITGDGAVTVDGANWVGPRGFAHFR